MAPVWSVRSQTQGLIAQACPFQLCWLDLKLQNTTAAFLPTMDRYHILTENALLQFGQHRTKFPLAPILKSKSGMAVAILIAVVLWFSISIHFENEDIPTVNHEEEGDERQWWLKRYWLMSRSVTPRLPFYTTHIFDHLFSPHRYSQLPSSNLIFATAQNEIWQP